MNRNFIFLITSMILFTGFSCKSGKKGRKDYVPPVPVPKNLNEEPVVENGPMYKVYDRRFSSDKNSTAAKVPVKNLVYEKKVPDDLKDIPEKKEEKKETSEKSFSVMHEKPAYLPPIPPNPRKECDTDCNSSTTNDGQFNIIK
ncbi:hypothetical protein KKD49_03695 [Myxococcota bacterium]|nr:hypothetical protein [Myxococcota bacterium]